MSSYSSHSGGRLGLWRATLVAAALLGAQGQSWADNLGLRGYTQLWDPSKPTLTSLQTQSPRIAPGVLSDGLVQAWNQYIVAVQPQLQQQLAQTEFAGQSGFTLLTPKLQLGEVYSIQMRTSPIPDLAAPAAYLAPSPSAPVIVIQAVTAQLNATTTTPYTVDNATPQVDVKFSLSAYIKLAIGARASAISVSSVAVVASNPIYTAHNGVPQDSQYTAPLQNVYGVASFTDKISSSLNNSNDVSITGAIASVIQNANNLLAQISPGGRYVAAGIFADPQWLNVVFAQQYVPNTTGSMSGTLNVQLPAGQRAVPNADCARVINPTDTVQVQPDYVGSLNPLQILKGSAAAVAQSGKLSISGGKIQATPDGWSCQYSVTGLADQAVNNIQFLEPAAGSPALPGVGYVVDVNFLGCQAGSTVGGISKNSAVSCLQACSDEVTPPSGSPANCNLVGTIQLAASAGTALAKPGAFGSASPSVGSNAAAQGRSVAPSVWGAQSVNRTVTTGTTSPQWGTSAVGTATGAPGVAPGSALNRGSALSKPLQTPATTSAPSTGSQF